MPEPTLESRIEELEEKLKKPQKDWWDKFQLLASLLIPASIAFCGIWLSRSMNQTQLESARQLADSNLKSSQEQSEKQQAIAKINARVGQAQFVGSFINALLDSNPLKQKLAINAVLIALPEEGPQFVAIVQQSETNEVIRKFAQSALDQRENLLVDSLHSDDPQKSATAADQLALGWHADTNLTKKLLAVAKRNQTSTNGVDHTLKVLSTLDASALRAYKTEVKEFTAKAQNNSLQRQIQARQIEAKF